MVKRPPDKIEVRKTTEYARTEIMGGVKGNAPVNKIYDEWYPRTIITMSNAGSSVKSVHPTQKPVALLEYLIKTYTLEGETVLDNTMGSGSTGVACINTARNFIGIEKDDKYFEIAKKRIEEHLTTAST
jgi:site-specific DNA-methyltransferase (adenine-specific)